MSAGEEKVSNDRRADEEDDDKEVIKSIKGWLGLVIHAVLKTLDMENHGNLLTAFEEAMQPNISCTLPSSMLLTLPLILASIEGMQIDSFFEEADLTATRIFAHVKKEDSTNFDVIYDHVYRQLRESVLTCEATVVKAVFNAVVGDAKTKKRISIPSNIPISPTKALESVKGLTKILKTKAVDLVSMFSENILFPVDFQVNIPELGIEAKQYVLQMTTKEAGNFAFWTSPLRLDKNLHLANHVPTMVAAAAALFFADSLTLNQLVPYLVESRYILLAPILDNLRDKVKNEKKRKHFDYCVESLKDECMEQRKRQRPVEEVVIPNIIRLIGDVLGSDKYKYAPAGQVGPDFQCLGKEDLIEKRNKRAVPRYATVVCIHRMGDVIVFLKRLVDIMKPFQSRRFDSLDNMEVGSLLDELRKILDWQIRCSPNTTLDFLKQMVERAITKPDGVCGVRCVFQTILRFTMMIKKFETIIPNELNQWFQTKRWNQILEDTFKSLMDQYTHHQGNDILTSSKITAVSVMERSLHQQKVLRQLGLRRGAKGALKECNEISTKVHERFLMAGGQKNYPLIPRNFSVERKLWFDMTHLLVLLYDETLYCPTLFFREMSNMNSCYMELHLTNRLFNCDNEVDHEIEGGPMSYDKLVANFECSFSNAIAYIAQCHFECCDLDTPFEEIRLLSNATSNLTFGLANRLWNTMRSNYETFDVVIEELDEYLGRYGYLLEEHRTRSMLYPYGIPGVDLRSDDEESDNEESDDKDSN